MGLHRPLLRGLWSTISSLAALDTRTQRIKEAPKWHRNPETHGHRALDSWSLRERHGTAGRQDAALILPHAVLASATNLGACLGFSGLIGTQRADFSIPSVLTSQESPCAAIKPEEKGFHFMTI